MSLNHSQYVDDDEDRWKELHEKDFDELTDAEITSKIRLSVKRRYSDPEWVLMYEYGAPHDVGRVCDCLAVSTLPSRNYKLIGFEFKASRSDWLREKKNPEKADYFVTMADEWYVVAPKGVVQDGELPEGWGHLELKPNSERLYTIVESNLTEHQQGEPPRRFWVRFVEEMTNGETTFSQKELREARSRGYRDGKDDASVKDAGISDRELSRLRNKADAWDELRSSKFGFVADWEEFDDETARTAELAFKLVAEIRKSAVKHGTDRVISSPVERVRDTFERLEEDLEGIESAFDTLVDRIDDGDDPLEELGGGQ